MSVEIREDAVLGDRYRLQQRLGSGGAGVVWRAHDHVLEREVAVKLLHAELAHDTVAAARFRSEASSAAKLTHPNAVMIYDIGRDGERDFLVMELVDGPSLEDLLVRAPMEAGLVAHLGAAVAGALGMAHRRGLLHRDVKPANVLLTRDGVPKVADFGIARALGVATSRLTLPGSVMGTARYLAPEQLVDGPLDGRVDVYALGLVLHEALTGRAPWGDGSAVEIASRRLSGDLPPASADRPELPPALDAVVARATRLDADERFEDGSAMAVALLPLVGVGDEATLARWARTTAAFEPSAPQRSRPARPPASGRRSSPPPRPGSVPPSHPPARPPSAPRSPQAPQPRSRATSRPTSPPPTRATGALRRRRRGRRIRRLAAVLLLVAVAVVGLLGAAAAGVSGVDELWETTRNSRVGELAQQVLDGLQERFGT